MFYQLYTSHGDAGIFDYLTNMCGNYTAEKLKQCILVCIFSFCNQKNKQDMVNLRLIRWAVWFLLCFTWYC